MDFSNQKLLDQIGLKILDVLQENARLPLSRISKKVGLSAPAVAERIRKLEEAGIISGYHARVAPEAVGRTVAAFINLTTDPSNYTSVKALAADMHQITSCHHISGDASFILHVQVADLPALESVVERLSPFGQTRTAIVLSTSVDKVGTMPLPELQKTENRGRREQEDGMPVGAGLVPARKGRKMEVGEHRVLGSNLDL